MPFSFLFFIIRVCIFTEWRSLFNSINSARLCVRARKRQVVIIFILYVFSLSLFISFFFFQRLVSSFKSLLRFLALAITRQKCKANCNGMWVQGGEKGRWQPTRDRGERGMPLRTPGCFLSGEEEPGTEAMTEKRRDKEEWGTATGFSVLGVCVSIFLYLSLSFFLLFFPLLGIQPSLPSLFLFQPVCLSSCLLIFVF